MSCLRTKVWQNAAVVIGPGNDSRLPRKVDQARWESGNLPREEETAIRLMEGDGVDEMAYRGSGCRATCRLGAGRLIIWRR